MSSSVGVTPSLSSSPTSPAARQMPLQERVVTFRPRTVFAGIALGFGAWAAVGLLALAQKGLTLIAIAMFLALALNPAVEFFQRRRLGRGAAVAIVCLFVLLLFALLGLVFIPPLVTQITHFVNALPGLVQDLTKGRGPGGFLERKYHVVEQVRQATRQPLAHGLAGAAAPAVGVAKTVATTLGGIFIIAFLTLFMLLEGPQWRRRLIQLVPESHQGTIERVGAGVYRSVSGFVTGNLLASFLAGVAATILLLSFSVPYALPLGLFTVIVELVPYIGPAVVTVLLSLVALTKSPVVAVVIFGLMLLYHLIEGHTVRPLIYGRALQLSALAVLIAIILGTELAGILGALAAIPVAGSIQVLISELIEQRGLRRVLPPAPPVTGA